MLTPEQQLERAEAITARLEYVVAHAANPAVSGRYTLPSTGKVIDFSRQKNGWSLSRLLYRVGELQVTQALDALLATKNLLMTEQDAYAFVRSLGIIGTAAHLPLIKEIAIMYGASAIVERAAKQSAEQLGATTTAATYNPASLAQYLAKSAHDDIVNDWIYELYLKLHSEQPELLPNFRQYLSTLPHRGNYFRPVRYVLKAAEQFSDYLTLSTLTYWIWSGDSESVVRVHYNWVRKPDGSYGSTIRSRGAHHPTEPYDWRNPLTPAEVSRSLNTKFGFTIGTRKYLVRRLFRRLNELGNNAAAEAYTTWAAELLLNFNGASIQPTTQETRYTYSYNKETNRWTSGNHQIYYPEGADLVPVHWLLHGRHQDFKDLRVDAAQASSRKPFTPGMNSRWERYPKLWDQQPEQVLRLLTASTFPPVLDFALRVFKLNPDFRDLVLVTDVLALVNSNYPPVNELALDLIRNRQELLTPQVAFAFITHPVKALRKYAKASVQLSFQDFFPQLLAEHDALRFGRGYKWLRSQYITGLQEISDDDIIALIDHPVPAAGHLAVEAIMYQYPLPYSMILRLMSSPHADVRAAGLDLFRQLPQEELVTNHRPMILSMCLSDDEVIRGTAVNVAQSLAEQYPGFARELVTTLTDALRQRGRATDVHNSIADLLTEDSLAQHLTALDTDTIWALLRSRKFPSHRVGLAAMRGRGMQSKLTTTQLVELGRHTFVDARELARETLVEQSDRTVYDAREFIHLLDTDWEDSREFAKQFLRDRLKPRDWTPELLTDLLDIPREDVQQFTLEFVDQHVDPAEATDFLLRASQHPGRHVQTFAAGWLDKYAAGNPAVIADLDYFFSALLGQISKGRLAKDRVFDFLEKESLASEPVARQVLPLLERLMLTIAIGDRARCLVLLNKLRRKYPHLDTPLNEATPEHTLSLNPKA